jgi:hypothetical protein
MATTAAHAAYPSVHNDTLGPEYIISITDGGTSIIAGPSFINASTPNPYDGVEDTYIGVENTSSHSVGFVDLTGSNIFGFDGDGICFYNPTNCSTVNPNNQNGGYAGGNTSGFVDTYFSIVNNSTGSVHFQGGLAPGQSAFFTLEEPLSQANVQITNVGGVPEPATWAMMLLGFFGVGGMVRSRRRAVAVA